MVRRVSRDADAGSIRHPDLWKPLEEQAESAPLTATVLAVVIAGLFIPFSPVANDAGVYGTARSVLFLSRCRNRQRIWRWWKSRSGGFFKALLRLEFAVMQILKAGALYFSLVFGAGLVLGTVRVL